MTDLDLYADTIDVRNIIARYEELEAEMPEGDGVRNWAELGEFTDLGNILEELKGAGGDEQWRGDWYPVTLTAERAFEDHVRQLLDDLGVIPADLPPYIHIDWESTANDIQCDYTSIEIDGTTYWYR